MSQRYGQEHMSVSITKLLDMGFVETVHVEDLIDVDTGNCSEHRYRTFYVYRCTAVPNTYLRFEPAVYDKSLAWYLVTEMPDGDRNEVHLDFQFNSHACPEMGDLYHFMRIMRMLTPTSHI